MKRKRRALVVGCVAWLHAMVAAPGRTQELEGIPAGYEVGLHIVREGDTLRGVTRAYLGSEELWRQNWRLNPEVVDPDVLYPLQRLRVLLAPELSRPTARLIAIAGEVEGKPAPADWNPALEDDLMIERDGVRAGDNASTVLQFQDGSRLTVKDESTVFLRVAGRSLRGVEQRAVEILEGQADLEAAMLPEEVEVEVIVANAVTVPKPGASGSIETRARRSGEGGAQVMIFEGEGEVEAGGVKVAVAAGMGTAVPKAGPPAPPEKLLPAANGLRPEAGGEVEISRSGFSWQQVEGAASYTVELCADPGCDRLVRRRTDLRESSWNESELPVGEFFWRVNAVSASGLDGYASESLPVRIVPERKDFEPPTGSIRAVGASVERDGVLYFGPQTAVTVSTEDNLTGVESVQIFVDGAAVGEGDLDGPWSSGVHEVRAEAVDGVGNRGAIGPLRLRVDADPPALSSRVGDRELLASMIGESEIPRRWDKRKRKRVQRTLKQYDRGESAPGWAVVTWGSRERSPSTGFLRETVQRGMVFRTFRVKGEDLRILLLSPALLAEDGKRLASRLLLIEAGDDGCGIDHLEFHQRQPEEDAGSLEVEIVDRLGNATHASWEFAVPARGRRP